MTTYAGYDNAMTTYAGCASIGADGSYTDVAAKAIQQIAAQNPSALYGYVRSGVHQKIYLFPLLEDATNWFSQHTQLEPAHDYAAVFAQADLRAPIPGMEHFNTAVSGEHVGNWVVPLIALPIGALAGYYYRRWQDSHPGKYVPFIQGDPAVGSWGELAGPQVGGPWHEMVGAEAEDSVRQQQSMALIQQAIQGANWYVDVFPSMYGKQPPNFFVWHLYPFPIPDDPTIGVSPGLRHFDTYAEALDHVHTMSDPRYALASAVFDRTSPHWPNPVNWTRQDTAQHASDIAAFLAKHKQPQVGGWHEIVGAQAQDDVARRAEWPQTRALIQSAIDAVTEAASMTPAAAYVWHLDAPMQAPYAGSVPGSIIVQEPSALVEAFNTQAQALARLREVALTRPIAVAMFERSTGHWPNPTAWSKSSDPGDAPLIAQYVASRAAATQMSGTYMGADPVASTAIAAVRQRAQQLADRRAGNVIGVIHTPKDNLWHTLAFRNEDDADDWLDLAAQTPASFTYAAYFNKLSPQWLNKAVPHQSIIEKISGMRSPPGTGLPRRSMSVMGAAIDDNRVLGKQLASTGFTTNPNVLPRRFGNAAGTLLASDGGWHVYGFTSLDNAIDWLQSTTREKSKFIYAAAYEKGRDGTAFIQDEEFGRSLPARTVSGRAA